MSAAEWFSGENKPLRTISLRPEGLEPCKVFHPFLSLPMPRLLSYAKILEKKLHNFLWVKLVNSSIRVNPFMSEDLLDECYLDIFANNLDNKLDLNFSKCICPGL